MHLKSIAIVIILCFWAFHDGFSQASSSAESEVIVPQKMAVTWGVQTNYLDDGSQYQSTLTLINKGDVPLREKDWAFYFNFMGMIDSKSLPSEVELTHINGDFYKVEPTEQFEPIRPGQQFAIPFEAPGSKIKKGDAPSGMYFVYGQEKLIEVISDIQVKSFTEERQKNRGPNDRLPHPLPDLKYEENSSLRSLPAGSIGTVIPTPKSITQKQGTFELNSSVTIGYQEGLENEARFLAASLAEILDGEITVEEGQTGSDILLALISSDANKSEAYELRVDSQQIEISGAGAAGVFYGIQSLRSLIPPEAYQEPQSSIIIGAQEIKDAPRFGYRGLHLDVARNFHSASSVKKLLDVMAFYKLNTFHFHLTDDEGWRLAVEELAELTEVGGRRGHTLTEDEHLIPSYGSGPDPETAPGSGWYDRDTFIEILRYASERHIEIIPEVDVPGHARAAIVAMKSRYNKLKAEGDMEAANRYRLHEPEDESQYRSVQNWDDNVINVCQPSTYRFIETVVDEIVEMYDEAGAPLTTIHMGGDEVPHGAWEQSPACQDLIQNADELESVDDLPDYFFERIEEILADHNLVMAGWEEIALDENEEGAKPDPDFAGSVKPYVWASVWGSGSEDHAYKLANAGYEVVMSHASNFYFDLSYNKDPEEPGLYWAGFVDTQDPYAFIPFDLFKNAEKNLLGNSLADDAFANATYLTESGRNNILGLQGQLWSEKLISQERLEYMMMPRLFGLAERSWAQQPDWAMIEDRDERKKEMNDDWNEFANRLGQRELPRMDYFHGGIHYRIPPPGAVIEDGVFRANVEYPGLTIRYTIDGSEPSVDSKEYTGPVVLEGNRVVKVRTFSSDGRGSRTVTVGGSK